MRVGLCGIGRMGSALAERLLDRGFATTIWNRTTAKTAPLAARGASVAASPRAVAAEAEICLTILTDEAAIDAVYAGPEGLLSGDLAGRLFIDLSTLAPKTTRALGASVAAAGGAFLECCVSGTIGPARDGQLLGLAGGEAVDFARARPVLDALCRRVELLGPIGAGHAMKFAINLPLNIYWEALGESFALCRDAGIDPNLMVSLMAESSGGTNALKGYRGPQTAAGIAAGEPQGVIAFTIAGTRKDLKQMVAFAAEEGFALPLAQSTLECYDDASAQGWGERDASALAIYRFLKAKRT